MTERNVGGAERTASSVAGAFLALSALRRGGLLSRVFKLASGGALLYRGASGHCPAYGALGVDNTSTGRSRGDGLLSPRTGTFRNVTTVMEAPTTIYEFLKNPKNLTWLFDRDWKIDVTEEVPGERIRWRYDRSGLAEVDGVFSIEPASGPAESVVHLETRVSPTGGLAGHALAKLLSPALKQGLKEGLRRMKRQLETGEIPTTHGQPTGEHAVSTDAVRRGA